MIVKKRVVLFCLTLIFGLCLFSACGRAPTGSLPRDDLEFRVVEGSLCADCIEIQRDLGAYGKFPLYVRPAFITTSDIRLIKAVSLSERENLIDFVFVSDSQERIRHATAENRGKKIALLAGGKVLYVATLSAEFSSSMRMSGLSPDELRQIYSSVSKPGGVEG